MTVSETPEGNSISASGSTIWTGQPSGPPPMILVVTFDDAEMTPALLVESELAEWLIQSQRDLASIKSIDRWFWTTPAIGWERDE